MNVGNPEAVLPPNDVSCGASLSASERWYAVSGSGSSGKAGEKVGRSERRSRKGRRRKRLRFKYLHKHASLEVTVVECRCLCSFLLFLPSLDGQQLLVLFFSRQKRADMRGQYLYWWRGDNRSIERELG